MREGVGHHAATATISSASALVLCSMSSSWVAPRCRQEHANSTAFAQCLAAASAPMPADSVPSACELTPGAGPGFPQLLPCWHIWRSQSHQYEYTCREKKNKSFYKTETRTGCSDLIARMPSIPRIAPGSNLSAKPAAFSASSTLRMAYITKDRSTFNHLCLDRASSVWSRAFLSMLLLCSILPSLLWTSLPPGWKTTELLCNV